MDPRQDDTPYTLITADTHAGASLATYREYLDPRWRDDFDLWRGAYRNPQRKHIGSKKTKNWDSDERWRDLEAEGVVGEIVFPNTVLPFGKTSIIIAHPPTPESYERDLAGLRAHNRWLADWCAEAPERRAGIGLVYLNDIDDALEDVQWIAEHGLRGGILLFPVPDHVGHLEPLYSPVFERLWAACQDLGLVINQHGGIGCPDYGDYARGPVMRLAEAGFYSKRGFTQLIMSGVFERFPKLQYILTEAGCAWAPSVLEQLDRLHGIISKGYAGEIEYADGVALPEKPSFYAARNCWYGASFPAPQDIEGREEVGVERICWGSDYPHYEGTFPYNREHLRLTFADIDRGDVRAMLGENAARLYGFDLEKLRPYAERCGPRPSEVAQPLPREEIPTDSLCPAFAVR